MNQDIQNSKIIRGCWQLASGHSGHNTNIAPILNAIEAGFKTFDCADIYLGTEELLGQASKITGKKLQIHTKFVPDLNCLQKIDCNYVENIINRSLKNLQVQCIDLVQFHWWDWEVKNYMHTMEILTTLKDAGKIKEIGVTNVSSIYLEELLQRFKISSLQTQVSLFDRRVERGISELCQKNGIKIFAYGVLLGGFLSEKWLAKAEPQLEELTNRSLVKYKLIIDSACGWEEFQRRLSILNELALKYRCKIANIATAALLQSCRADAVIIGLSPQNYADQNSTLRKQFSLAPEDLQRIATWACDLPGDIYDLERDVTGAHAKIMKYDLNSLKN